ncbi:MAG: hypothetical protein KGQ36_03480 [Rickettsiales bacterium]|nr:hypothetical protein [Rickettsiales bacterium]
MPEFLNFANKELQKRFTDTSIDVVTHSWVEEEKLSEEERKKQSKKTLDLSEVTRILQKDLDRQIISQDSILKTYYDFYKALDDDKTFYQQEYVGVGKDFKQNELKDKTREFFEKIKEKYPANQVAIELLEKDLTNKIDADEQVAMAVPYLMLQTITYFDQIDKIEDKDKKCHFLSQFPMTTRDEYACVGGFSSRLNPILMMLNAENVHLTSAHQSAVSSSKLNKEDGVHHQAMMSALFGVNLKDEHYLLPAGAFTSQQLWKGYLDYHVKLQEQFLLQQEQVKQDVIDLAKLFDAKDRGEKTDLEVYNELKKFSLNYDDFCGYDEDELPIIDDKKVKEELERE